MKTLVVAAIFTQENWLYIIGVAIGLATAIFTAITKFMTSGMAGRLSTVELEFQHFEERYDRDSTQSKQEHADTGKKLDDIGKKIDDFLKAQTERDSEQDKAIVRLETQLKYQYKQRGSE